MMGGEEGRGEVGGATIWFILFLFDLRYVVRCWDLLAFAG